MLYAMFAMLVLTMIIGSITLKTRFASVKTGQVKARYYRLMEGQEVPEFVAQTTRSFNNQFEVPMLFYVACLLHIHYGTETALSMGLAWAFVATRLVHTCIHLTYNHVLHRLSAYWLGMLCVLALWVLVVVAA